MYCNINPYTDKFMRRQGIISVLSLTNPYCPSALSFKGRLINLIKTQVTLKPQELYSELHQSNV